MKKCLKLEKQIAKILGFGSSEVTKFVKWESDGLTTLGSITSIIFDPTNWSKSSQLLIFSLYKFAHFKWFESKKLME